MYSFMLLQNLYEKNLIIQKKYYNSACICKLTPQIYMNKRTLKYERNKQNFQFKARQIKYFLFHKI